MARRFRRASGAGPGETAAAIEDGWLHTGDVGKRDAEGWYYLVDRIKDMVNVSSRRSRRR